MLLVEDCGLGPRPGGCDRQGENGRRGAHRRAGGLEFDRYCCRRNFHGAFQVWDSFEPSIAAAAALNGREAARPAALRRSPRLEASIAAKLLEPHRGA
jgi:hypothetical protein